MDKNTDLGAGLKDFNDEWKEFKSEWDELKPGLQDFNDEWKELIKQE